MMLMAILFILNWCPGPDSTKIVVEICKKKAPLTKAKKGFNSSSYKVKYLLAMVPIGEARLKIVNTVHCNREKFDFH